MKGLFPSRERAFSPFSQVLSLFLFLFSLAFFSPSTGFSAQVSLAWDPNTEPNLARYKLHYGTSSRNYSQIIDTGLNVSRTVTNLSDASTYYFAVTAENTEGASSAFSNEVTFSAAAPTTYSLTISKNGTGNGAVNSTPTGTSFNAGTVVTLTATPDASSQFGVWSGACTGTSPTCSVTMDANKTVTATFNLKTYSITATAGVNGSITPAGATLVAHGGSQAYTITAGSGYRIADVKVDGASIGAVGSYSFSNVTAAHTIEATFTNTTFNLTVSKNGTGNGTVSNNPSGSTFNAGTAVTLTATPDASSVFGGWSGGSCSGTIPTCSVTMDANKTVMATFTVKTFTITAGSVTNGTISPSGATTVTYGASQAYTITPASGYGVAGVTVDGSSLGTVSSYTFSNVTASHAISATFAANTYTLTINKAGNGNGTITNNLSGSNLISGTVVSITALPDSLSVFGGWSGACTGTSPTCTVTMSANASVTATFLLETNKPVSSISQPTGGATIPKSTYTIKGTADDRSGSGIQKVEVSLDNGQTWKPASGTGSWSHEWQIPAAGTYLLKSRATDLVGNMETPAAGVSVTVLSYQPTPVQVSGRQLLVKGAPFTVKGVVYSPTPIGDDPQSAPFGDYFTDDFSAIHDRDLPVLRELGANALRLPYWDNAADHHQFLDKAYNGGINPIYVIAGYWIDKGLELDPLSNLNVRESLKSDFRQMVAQHKDHPAILMWSIGSDLNDVEAYGNKLSDLFSLINEMASESQAEEGLNYHPVTTALKDQDLIETIATFEGAVPKVGVWGANVYRGNTFGSLFADFERASQKPLIILEYGIDAYDHTRQTENESFQADYAELLWKEIMAKSQVCLGGSIREYSDQEEWWGLVRMVPRDSGIDGIEPRAAYSRLQQLWRSASLDLISPNGGERLRVGRFQSIRWNYSGPIGSLIRIELLKKGTVYRTLAQKASVGSNGSGSFTWFVPFWIKTGSDYQIRITSVDNGQYKDTSGSIFTITNR